MTATTATPVFEVGLRAIPLSEIGWAELTITEARELLDRIEVIEGDVRHLDTKKLATIVKMIVADKSLAEISAKTGIPLVVMEDEYERRVLREEVTSFGTWLGQRDNTLKEVPATDIFLPADLKGCANAKRNIVVSHGRGDLGVATYADYLDQRYAQGDLTWRRNIIPTMATMAQVRGYGGIVKMAYEAVAESNGVPGAMWSRAIDLVLTGYENLERALDQLSKSLAEKDANGVDEALSAAAWVNNARVRMIRQAARQVREGNSRAGRNLSAQITEFRREIAKLVEIGPDGFLEAIEDLGLLKPFLDVYVPDDESGQEREARDWLRERGLSRQAAILLSHTIWALNNAEISLLEECLQARASGSRSWEAPLLEAQLNE